MKTYTPQQILDFLTKEVCKGDILCQHCFHKLKCQKRCQCWRREKRLRAYEEKEKLKIAT